MAQTLSEIVGSQNMEDPSSHPAKLYSIDGMIPKVVLFPGNIEEVSQILTFSSQERESIIPWGNGTKMGWGNIPSKVDRVVNTKRLDRITDCEEENLTATVEAGVPLVKVQAHLRGLGRGYFIPLDPPFTQAATIGGIVASNSSGPKRYLYGTARDLILGMKVILPNGKINSWGGKSVKNVAGYDMCKLYIGSFGTLGIIGEVTFRLLPLPEKERTLVAVFRESRAAFEAVSGILQSELLPSAIEISNLKVFEVLGFELSGKSGKVLLAVGFEGFHESVERQIRQVKERVESSSPFCVYLLEGAHQDRFWTGLRDFESIAYLRFPDTISCRVNVPISKTGDVFRLWKEMMDEKGLDLGLRCHAGSGIVYADILMNDPNLGTEEWFKILRKAREAIRNLEGGMVIQKASPLLKKQIDVWGTPGKDFSLIQNLKARFDPDRLLNPGRFVGGI
ncbi:MAG: hypothetical protein A2157_04980 [Deltaproteobacteria bacterium RBG_16_47_11]|nr:MAG: hypothetical protein A2157_04980 [Deltaproteobacteria bacterium RBG_16_47_11]